MAARSIASLSLSFGLVSIPVKVYSATESSAAIRFKLLSRGGARVRRQYVADESEAALVSEDENAPTSRDVAAPLAAHAAAPTSPAPGRAAQRRLERGEEPAPAERLEVAPDEAPAPPPQEHVLAPSQMVKGYEFEKGRFVTFSEAELKELAEAARPTIDIVSFIPEGAVDPVYYDKAYYLAPDRQGERPYSLLRAAMQESGRCALAKWAWRAKEYVVQIRAVAGGLALQQLLYAEEVRPIDALHIDLAEVGPAELQLALRLIEQISDDAYHPERFVDEEKQRILAAVERKIAGRGVVARPAHPAPSAQVIDLVAALRASLDAIAPTRGKPGSADARARAEPRERKPARRAAKAALPAEEPAGAPAPVQTRRRQSPR